MIASENPSGPNWEAWEAQVTRENTLGLNAATLLALCERLDEAASATLAFARAHKRFPYRHTGVGLSLTHPGGSQVTVRVAARSLSNGGISVLHCGYLHADSPCLVLLVDLERRRQTIPARVAHCRHLGDVVHEIGLAFAEPTDVRMFIAAADLEAADTREQPDPATLTGTIVCIDASALDRRHVVELLRPTGLTVIGAGSVEEAVRDASGADPLAIHTVFLSVAGAGRRPAAIAKDVRANFTAKLVLLAPGNSARSQELVRVVQPNAVLVKPIAQGRLFRVLFHLARAARTDAGPMRGAA
ncbi:MAG: hypothetical protein FJ255_09600 [Phycisphaerae bacterium]|nr:hypothetical protein [Phycisphaerae bacterium]